MKLQLSYVNCLWSLCSVYYFELHFSALVQGLEAFHVQSRVVYEYIVAGLIGDEAVTLLIVEPLNCTFVHDDTSKK